MTTNYKSITSSLAHAPEALRSWSARRSGARQSSRRAPACFSTHSHKMPLFRLRPNLYRTVRVVMSDGSTYRQPSAVRMVGGLLALERDAANHPVYLGLNDLSGMVDRREEMRLQKIAQRRAKREGSEDEDEV